MTVWSDAFSGRANISLQLTVTESVNSAANQSTINWSLKAVETASQPSFLYDPTATAFVTFTFDSSVSGQSLVSGDMTPSISNWEYDFSPSGNQSKTIGSGSFIVNHNTLGQGALLVYAGATDSQGNLGSAAIGTSSSRKSFPLTDFNISAVAPTVTVSRSGTDIVVSRTTPTSGTGGTQTFTTWLSKNGGAYTNIGSTTPITTTSLATDYASAYSIASFDGATMQSSTVSIFGVPFAPAAPTISNAVTTSLTLSWTAPGTNGSAITSYIIQATTDDGANWSNLYTGVTATTKNVTGLTIAATYKFRIIAVSAVGNSADGSTSDAYFVSAYGYRYTSPTVKEAIKTAARYTGNESDSIVVGGTTYTKWKMIQNVKKYQGGTWTPLEK